MPRAYRFALYTLILFPLRLVRFRMNEHIKFLVLLYLFAVWIGTTFAIPLGTILLIGNYFVASCSTRLYVERVDDYTIPKRAFAVFVCIELITTRLLCFAEFYRVLHGTSGRFGDTPFRYFLRFAYMWSTIVTTLTTDTIVLCWVFFTETVCKDNHDIQQMYTIDPFCHMTSHMNNSVLVIHIGNASMLFVLGVLVQAISIDNE